MAPTALITGASGSIGRAAALRLGADGYRLVLHYNRNLEAVRELLVSLEKAGCTDVHTIQADLAAAGGVQRLISGTGGEVDVLVHNSGKSYTGLVQDFTAGDTEQAFRLGLGAPYEITNGLLPGMLAKKKGKIIVISSIWGLTGASCEVLYSMIKGGLNAYVKALAKELGPSGIQVNAVAPGLIDTPMNEHMNDAEREALLEEIPAGRPGTPEDVAEAVAYLASPASDYVSGQILSVNGAWHC
ncbi:elongation factor P 5-aminopentanone reductase [Alteribacter natronophilus]|uniref:elongation factor P 5-aminopentanone reductase n=1 Tax=Alteribacter natronophilus TaxID=2583810 RepID=UPI00110E26A9|nr:SDR family oxidoreductase [Alteribacter natronophilus]TMW73269.1 SDR family oxidoreductase [Alteribacter natronophilus]